MTRKPKVGFGVVGTLMSLSVIVGGTLFLSGQAGAQDATKIVPPASVQDAKTGEWVACPTGVPEASIKGSRGGSGVQKVDPKARAVNPAPDSSAEVSPLVENPTNLIVGGGPGGGPRVSKTSARTSSADQPVAGPCDGVAVTAILLPAVKKTRD
jgi:hypothetical protein